MMMEKVYVVMCEVDDEHENFVAAFDDKEKAEGCVEQLSKTFPKQSYFVCDENLNPDVEVMIKEMIDFIKEVEETLATE